MPIPKHYKAARCIEKRIQELNKEIELSNKIMEEPEMHADYYYAKIDKENFESEIESLRGTLQFLIESE